LSTPKWHVGPSDAMREMDRSFVKCGDVEVCVFRSRGGALFAIENVCPHQGGPVCEGRLSGTLVWDDENDRIEWTLDGAILTCPWHGVEFDVSSGAALGGIDMRLRRRQITDDGRDLWVGSRI